MLFHKLSGVLCSLYFLHLAVQTDAVPKKKKEEPKWSNCPEYYPPGVNCLEPIVCEAQWPSGSGNYDDGKTSFAKRGADVLPFSAATEFLDWIFEMMENNTIVWSDDLDSGWTSPQIEQELESKPIQEHELSPRGYAGRTITLTAPTTIRVALPTVTAIATVTTSDPNSVSISTLIVTDTKTTTEIRTQSGIAESTNLLVPDASTTSVESIGTTDSAEPASIPQESATSTVLTEETASATIPETLASSSNMSVPSISLVTTTVVLAPSSTTSTSSSRSVVPTIGAEPATCCRPTAECWAFIQTTSWFAKEIKKAKMITDALTWKKALCCVASYLRPQPRCPGGGHKIDDDSLFWLRPPQCSEVSEDPAALRAFAIGQPKIFPLFHNPNTKKPKRPSGFDFEKFDF
jgi:hypothetical protein